MSSGPKAKWRCPECGTESTMKITAGAEFIVGAGVQLLACPNQTCTGTPVIVALDDLRLDA